MSEILEIFVGGWQRQPIILALWSLVCVILGMVFAAGLYTYRIRRAMRKAARKLEELALTTNTEHTFDRRQTDGPERRDP